MTEPVSPSRAAGEARAWRLEAAQAWESEARRLASPSWPSGFVLALVAPAGAFTVAAVGYRLAQLFEGRALAVVLTGGLAALLALALIAVPLVLARRRGREARARIAEARGKPVPERCPHCDGPLAGEARCACGARVAEAEGLSVVWTGEERWRRLRWRAAVRARLGGASRPGGEWTLSPIVWTALTVLALGLEWSVAAALGGTPPSTVEAPLALDRPLSMHRTARASSEPSARPAGSPTRRRAPAWVGTEVLARRDAGPHHELAVIVREDEGRAFVVYAGGGSAWVSSRALLTPELAPDDVVEVERDGRFADAVVLDRLGPALRVRIGDDVRWTSAARVRVRSDAAHRSGEGLEALVPEGAWVEVREGREWLPGLEVDTARGGLRVLVVGSDGQARWAARDDVRPQRIEPGVRVRVEGAPMIVAARIGHALAVVGPDGRRRWTSVATVGREDGS